MSDLIEAMAVALVNGDWDDLPELHKILALTQARKALAKLRETHHLVPKDRTDGDDGELVERLKLIASELMGRMVVEGVGVNATCHQAADHLTALSAEVERLKALLVRGYVVCDGDDDDAASFRNDARQALGAKP